MTYKANAAMRCVFLCVLLNLSQSAWHILCLTQFQFVYINKWCDQGQTSSPISSRILMLGFESLSLTLIVAWCSLLLKEILIYVLHHIFSTFDIVVHLGCNKKSEATREDYIHIVMCVDICKAQSHSFVFKCPM